jgi:rhodanese-related sulfurtransferase
MAGTIVEDVSLNELKQGLADGSIILVDIREQYEWDAGHIPGATFHPLSAFNPSALPKADAGKRVVLHCRSGRRTLMALEAAQASGRDDIRAHFGGGMLAWEGAGETVEL